MSSSPEYKTFHIGGIPTHVFGLNDLPSTPNPKGLAVLFHLHGRFGYSLEPNFVAPITNFLETSRESLKKGGKGLIVVAFDQRNHGVRTTEKERNSGWKDSGDKGDGKIENQSHASDMTAIQLGTARDVSLLIDTFESSVFPNDENKVTDWWCGGVSLGGHATWLVLAHESRISVGIPIIGSPDMLTLLGDRAKGISLPIAGPYFPRSLLNLWSKFDAINVPTETWQGKQILILSGGDDKLVNYEKGGTGDFVENKLKKAVGSEGRVEVMVEEGTGHAYSKGMVERTCTFLAEQLALAAPTQARI